MQVVRRLYLYAVTFISLETMIWGVTGLARSIINGNALVNNISQLAGALSAVLVGVPVFLLHWWLAQRGAAQRPDERYARLRAIFLYGTMLATLAPIVQNLLALVSRTILNAMGLETWRALLGGYQTSSDNFIAIITNAIAAAYIFKVLRDNWRSGLATREGAEAATPEDDFLETRRLYRYLWVLYGLAMVVFGSQQVLKFILSVPQSLGNEPQISLANGLTLLLVGAPLWVFAWRLVQRIMGVPGETDSGIRLVVLYALTLLSAGCVLTAGALALNQVLRLALALRMSLTDLLMGVRSPLSLGIPVAAVWGYYGQTLSQAIQARLELARRASLQRVLTYALSLYGLGATFLGLHSLLTFLIEFILNTGTVLGEVRSNTLSVALAALAVGLPTWLLTWRHALKEADDEDDNGDRARRSVVRKGYLYLALFAGVIGVMASIGMMFYRLISLLLGQPQENLTLDLAQMGKTALLFSLLLIYHGLALRQDGHMMERTQARRRAQYPVLLLAPEEAEFAERLLSALEREASGVPVAVHPYSKGAPDESLSTAKAVILPAELMANPTEALRLWLQGYGGRRLVLPTPTGGWHWIAGSGHSLTWLARQTAQAIRHLAEGEEPPAPRQSSPWLIAVYVLAVLFAFQILALLLSVVLQGVVD